MRLLTGVEPAAHRQRKDPSKLEERQSVRRKNYSKRKPWEDEVLGEVYAGRDAHAAQFE